MTKKQAWVEARVEQVMPSSEHERLWLTDLLSEAFDAGAESVA